MKDKLNIKNIEEYVLQNKKNLFIFFAISALLMSIPCFLVELYVGKDLTFHVYRIQELAANLKHGYLLPAVQFDNLLGYGYMTDIFYPNFFLYPFAILSAIGLSPLISFQLFIIVINLVTLYTSRYSYYIITKNEKDAVYFSIFYTLFPFRILNLYINGFFGEYIALIFIPLAVSGLYLLFKEQKDKSVWKLIAIGMIGIVYSHVLTLLLMVTTISIVCIFNIKKTIKSPTILLDLLKAGVVSFICGLGFLIPIINYMGSDVFKYVYNTSQSGIVASGPVFPIFISIPLQIILLIVLYKIYNKKKSLMRLITLVILYAIVMQTYLFPWALFDMLPGYSSLQFSFRVLNIIMPLFAYVLLDTIHIYEKLKSTMILFLFSFILFVIAFGGQSVIKLQTGEDEYIINYNDLFEGEEKYQKNTFIDVIAAEYLPLNFTINNEELLNIDAKDFIEYNEPHFSYDSKVIEYNKANGILNLEFTTDTKTDITLPLTYYKNYKAYVDGKQVEIYHDNGLINLKDMSSGKVLIKYEISADQIYTAIISGIAFLLFSLYIHISERKQNKIDKNS